MPLRLAKYGVPLAETSQAGPAAAGIEPVVIPSAELERETPRCPVGAEQDQAPELQQAAPQPQAPQQPQPQHGPGEQQVHAPDGSAWFYDERLGSRTPATYRPEPSAEEWYAAQ